MIISPSNTLSVRAILFDLDGTLVDTLPDLYRALVLMTHEMNLPAPTLDTARAYVGRGVHNLLRRIVTGQLEVDETMPLPEGMLESYQRHYANENGRESVCFDGVAESLAALKDAGFSLGVVTNKPMKFTPPLLQQLGLYSYFDLIMGGDSLPETKPDPMPLVWACGRLNTRPEETLFIGDSVNDFVAARRAHCPVFLLPYGYNEGRDIKELTADAHIDTLRDILPRVSFSQTPHR